MMKNIAGITRVETITIEITISIKTTTAETTMIELIMMKNIDSWARGINPISPMTSDKLMNLPEKETSLGTKAMSVTKIIILTLTKDQISIMTGIDRIKIIMIKIEEINTDKA